MKDKTIVLIDGHSLFHRAFFAIPSLTNSKGVPTNAVYGFLTMLLRLLEDEEPGYIAVAFDRAEPTFRHRAYKDYKAHRPEMAEDLSRQGPLLKEALAALGVRMFEREGYEADDVIGTLAKRAAERGMETVIVTGDRDLLQLVGPLTRVLITRKGISEMERFDEAAVRDRYGVPPARLVDVKALQGDPSDNIPGVPGIGEKTALKLIGRFGSLDALYEHSEEAGGPKTVAALVENRGQAELSRDLARIVTDVPLEAEPDGCRRREPDREALAGLFRELEFGSLARRLGLDGAGAAEDAGSGDTGPAVGVRVAGTPEDVEDWFSARAPVAGDGAAEVSVAWVPVREGLRERPGALAVLAGSRGPAESTGPAGEALYIPAEDDDVREAFAAALTAPDVEVTGHDLKLPARWLRKGGRGMARSFDVAVAAYLLDPTRAGYRLEDLARRYLDRSLPPVAGEARRGREPETLPREKQEAALAAHAAALAELRPSLEAELEAMGVAALFRDLEMPLVDVLAVMEEAGILVDPATLDELGREFTARAAELEAEIHALAGEPFNINSPRQLGQILFDKLGLPAARKTKTGYSTDAAVLASLADKHPIAAGVLEYRHLVKLLGTYVEGLRGQIDPADGRVHCTFQQTVTATGRLSSTDPNLQNIPVREEMGRRLRRAFTAAPGRLLLAADYSQIELRILAHISGDEGLIAAFREGADIHRATAAEVAGVSREEVSAEMRDRAKAINFGIVYGISDFGLSQNLGISRAEAREFIDRYFARYPGVKRYCGEIVKQARRDGFVRTLMGRVRPLPEIVSRNFVRRQFAERTALNTPIQGTAADIIKVAMLRVHRELVAGGHAARLLLQVHDELILEVPEAEMEEVVRLVRAAMEGSAELAVPLKVDMKAGPNWYDMQPRGG